MKCSKLLAALAGLSSVVVGVAHAAVPAAVSTSFTSMSDDFTTIFGYGFTALTVVVVAMLAWRYTRKLGSKI